MNSVVVNGQQLTEGQYNVENLMLTIGADLLKDNNEIVINGEHTVIVTLVQ